MGEKERIGTYKSKNKNLKEENDYEPEIRKPIDPKRVLQILEYRRKTMDFVESILQPDITIEYLRLGEEFLCQRDYDGITQERYLSKMCGWPICSNELTKVWKQKYHVSLRDKKIYDVEIRKLFCSVHCMNTSNKYRDNNLPEQPIWMRLDDPNIDEINNLNSDNNNIIIKESNATSSS